MAESEIIALSWDRDVRFGDWREGCDAPEAGITACNTGYTFLYVLLLLYALQMCISCVSSI